MNMNVDRTKIPPLGNRQELLLNEPRKLMLDNGIELYLINGEETEVTRLDIVFEAGTAFQEKKLTAASVNKLLQEGTKQRSSREISETLDYYGAYLEPFVTKESAGITLYALTKYYDVLLPLLFEMVVEAVFPGKELALHLDRELHDFKVKISKVRYRAMLEFNRMMFGKDTPYGRIAAEEDFKNVNREDLIRFYRQRYLPENCYMILSGKVDDTLTERLNAIFGQPWNKQREEKFLPEIYTGYCKHKELMIPRKGALQSAIRIGRTLPGKTDDDYHALVLFNTLLGGYFGSRLMTSLREKKGLTYGIHSFIRNYPHGNYFSISTEVKASATKIAVEEIFSQLTLLRGQPVSSDELQLVKNYLYGTFLRGFDGPFALADRFKNVKEFNLTFGFYKKHLHRMMELSEKDLIETANKYFRREDLKLLVVGEVWE